MRTTPKTCLLCSKPVHGRADKKFCNDSCRNLYHNQLNSETNDCMRSINRYLRNNRRILQGILQQKGPFQKIPQQVLQTSGFQFLYYTHQQPRSKGAPVFYCYDLGYRLLKSGYVHIVPLNERNYLFQ